jgi:hypothetical protein
MGVVAPPIMAFSLEVAPQLAAGFFTGSRGCILSLSPGEMVSVIIANG